MGLLIVDNYGLMAYNLQSMVENPLITKDKLQMAGDLLGAVELTVERMAKEIVDNKRGRKKLIKLSEEEQLLQVPEYFEIARTLIVTKFCLGLMSEGEKSASLKKIWDSHDAVKKKSGLTDSPRSQNFK